jgi:hypothetical protein
MGRYGLFLPRVGSKRTRKGWNGTHRLLACDDGVKIVEENIDTIKKNTGALLDVSKEVGLEMNPEKTKYILMSGSQNIG